MVPPLQSVVGKMVTTGMTTVTVTEADPDFPSLVAVIVVVPPATPVTNPVVDTVATLGAELLQFTVRPVSVPALTSANTAVNCWVVPAASEVVAGLTVTVATGTGVRVVGVEPSLQESTHASSRSKPDRFDIGE